MYGSQTAINTMDSSIVTQLIDEIVEACVATTMPETIETIPCDFSVADVKEYDKENIIPLNWDVNDQEDIIDRIEALEIVCEPADDDDIGPRDVGYGEVKVPQMATHDGMKLNSSSGHKPQGAVDSLRSKGYSTCTHESFIKVSNLLLLQNSSKFTKHDVRCEGFPTKMTEFELVSLFEKCGPVFVLKRRNFENVIFVTYTKTEDAERAVKSFDCRDIKGYKVRVSPYVPECRLKVIGISSTSTKNELFRRFAAATSKLISVQVFKDPVNEGRILRFCYLQYSSCEEAAQSKRRLSKMLPSNLSVQWSGQNFEADRRRFGNESVENRTVELSTKHSEKTRDRISRSSFSRECDHIALPSSSATLHLKNVRPTISTVDLRKCFTVYGEVISVDKDNDSASVCFREPEDAKRAAQDIDKYRFGDNVQISFVDLLKTSDTLYIYNIFADITTKQLRTLFSVYGEVMDIDLSDSFAIVRFNNNIDSEVAVQRIDRKLLGMASVEISYFPK